MSNALDNLRVVLVAPRNPLNIGAVARAMSNFGAMHLRVVTPYEKAWREAKSAVGAAELLARAKEFASVSEAVADCSLVVGTTAVGNREIRQPLRHLEEARPMLRKGMAKSHVALLFGSEKWGLSNESLSHCHWLLRVPTREAHRSMNLGQAVAVCLYELGRGTKTVATKNSARRENNTNKGANSENKHLENTKRDSSDSKLAVEKRLATMEIVDRITAALLEALYTSGYVAPKASALAEEKLRRMIRRFHLEAADAEVFLGMIHKILWKLGQT